MRPVVHFFLGNDSSEVGDEDWYSKSGEAKILDPQVVLPNSGISIIFHHIRQNGDTGGIGKL